MYKLLFCWRYLRTRYIALASIVSVMLGVATLVVVNAVMEGARTEMQGCLHDILGDVIIESRHMDGAPDPERMMAILNKIAGDQIEGMSPTAVVPAALQYHAYGNTFTKQITLIGIDPEHHQSVSDVGRFLQHPENREHLSFDLKHAGYDVYDHQEEPDKAIAREQMRTAGWEYRRMQARYSLPIVSPPSYLDKPAQEASDKPAVGQQDALVLEGLPPDPWKTGSSMHHENVFDPTKQTHTGCIPGIGLCSFRDSSGADKFFVVPGHDVTIMFPSAGQRPEPRSAKLTVTDLYESKVGEYDANCVFMPFHQMQDLRGLIDPTTKTPNFNSILIRLKPGADTEAIRDAIRNSPMVPETLFAVMTWRDKQGPVLAAIENEVILLNILLFMIIAVAGFGILAIFLMIVVEKTRDIGILKSLGASGAGVMGVFLGYGLTLGAVGAGTGVGLGLLIVAYINDIKDFVSWATGAPVFDPSVYNFLQIPAVIDPFTIAWVTVGAMLIAVLASILPAWRAASLHPVQALRWE